MSSNISFQWLNFIDMSLQTAKNNGEYKIRKTKKVYYKVDGYDPKTKTVYEFHGDYWHGNPKVYNPNDMNTKLRRKFGTLYNKTQQKKALILKQGYKYVEMWESDWIKGIRALIIVQRKWKNKQSNP